jgi:pimeloyl-ACP methyl ester carboxylesterase
VPFLSAHGHRLRYREAGRPDGAATPVVLVHGAGASSAIWLGIAHRLGRTRRVVALDLPGHGQSPGRAESVEQMRDVVGLACAALCLPRAILVGHSLGGQVVLAAGLAWPDKVAGVGVVTSGAKLKVSPAIFEALRPDAWPRWPELLAQAAYSPETPADTRRRGAGIACAASREQTEADFRAAAAFDARAALPGLSPPLLVVTGEHDLLTPPRWGQALHDAVPGSRLAPLPACGHMPMHERPDDLTRALCEFIDGIPARTD